MIRRSRRYVGKTGAPERTRGGRTWSTADDRSSVRVPGARRRCWWSWRSRRVRPAARPDTDRSATTPPWKRSRTGGPPRTAPPSCSARTSHGPTPGRPPRIPARSSTSCAAAGVGWSTTRSTAASAAAAVRSRTTRTSVAPSSSTLPEPPRALRGASPCMMGTPAIRMRSRVRRVRPLQLRGAAVRAHGEDPGRRRPRGRPHAGRPRIGDRDDDACRAHARGAGRVRSRAVTAEEQMGCASGSAGVKPST